MVRPLSLTLIAVVAVLAVPSSWAAPQAGTRADAKKLTFRIMSLSRVTIPHDKAPKGRENRGDWISYRSLLVSVGPLFGKKKKFTPVGFEVGTYTFTSATTAKIRSQAKFEGQGTILIRGPLTDHKDGTSTVPIVGGTGRFSGAHGVLVISPGTTLKAVNTYRLTLPAATGAA